jgi:hypothetical protein
MDNEQIVSWLNEANEAMGDAGSNDAEHDCLVTIVDALSRLRPDGHGLISLPVEIMVRIAEDDYPLDGQNSADGDAGVIQAACVDALAIEPDDS